MKIIYECQNSVSITSCPFIKGVMVGSHACGNCDFYIDHKNGSQYIDGYVICKKENK